MGSDLECKSAFFGLEVVFVWFYKTTGLVLLLGEVGKFAHGFCRCTPTFVTIPLAVESMGET